MKDKPKAGEWWWVYTRMGMRPAEIAESKCGYGEHTFTCLAVTVHGYKGDTVELTDDGELYPEAPEDWSLVCPMVPPPAPTGRVVDLNRAVCINGVRGSVAYNDYSGTLCFSEYKPPTGRAQMLKVGDLISYAGRTYRVAKRDRFIRMDLPVVRHEHLRAEPGHYRPRPGARLAPYRHLLGTLPDATVARLAGVGRSCASRMKKRLLRIAP